MPRINPLLDQLAAYPVAELNRRKEAVLARKVRLFDFSVGDPVEPTPEFIRQALLGAVPSTCPYPSVKGRLGVRVAIADYMQRRFGVSLDPETQVLPTAGSKEAVFHTPLLVVDPHAPDRKVVFPDPGYPAYQRGALFAGADAHGVVLQGDYVFRPWELPDAVLAQTRMLWLNTPHNPSGAVMSLSDLERTAELCRKWDILCISDETYADLYHEEQPHSLLEAGVEGMLVLHSLSKRSGMTGYRSGFLAGDPRIIGRLKDLRDNPGLAAQDFVNAAAEVAWADDRHVVDRRSVFTAKRALFLEFFAEMGVEVVGSAASIYLWLRVPGHGDDERWAQELLQHGIVVSPGRMFGVAGGGAGYVRLALVPPIEECAEAILLWRRILRGEA
jgi:LL-diaminopimelate aminotransferase